MIPRKQPYTLKPEELDLAKAVARKRQRWVLDHEGKRSERPGETWEDKCKDALLGVKGEIAMARFFGIEYTIDDAMKNFRKPDFYGFVEVRTTRWGRDPWLFTKPTDSFSARDLFVLCSGSAEIEVRTITRWGWTYGDFIAAHAVVKPEFNSPRPMLHWQRLNDLSQISNVIDDILLTTPTQEPEDA